MLIIAVVADLRSGPLPQAGVGEQTLMLAAALRARQALPLMSGLSFLISPLLIGLLVGASVSAWRTLNAERALDVTA